MKTKAMGWCIRALFGISFLMMAAGWYMSSVPLFAFNLGVCGFLLSVLLFVVHRKGAGALLVLGFFAFLIFIMLPSGLIPIPTLDLEKDYPRQANELTEKSDLLKEKHPPYVPDMIERQSGRYYKVYINKSASVLALDLGEATSREKKLSSRLYPTFSQAIKAAGGFDCELLPSVELIDQYKKSLDDHLLAALEVHLSTGSSIFPGGKQALLEVLLKEVLKRNDPGRNEAAAYLAAAIELGGGRPDVSRAVKDKAQAQVQLFLKQPARSEPIGFYTQSATLEHVFRRDRFLADSTGQNKRITLFIPIALALGERPDLLRAYNGFRNLEDRLCNAEVDLNLVHLLRHKGLFGSEDSLLEALFNSDAPEVQKACYNKGRMPSIAFWPAATSKESRLFARIYSSEELPESSCMEDLIVALRSGETNLDINPDSGYYDYQLHALESLVLPERAQEAQKLLLQAKYKKRLREAFEAMLTKRRETHVKHLEFFATAGDHSYRPPIIMPELSIEPCATNYLRTARAYRFLVTALKSQFSNRELDHIKLTGSRDTLLQQLNNATSLFYGLYLTVCNDIGMIPKLENGEIESVADFGINLKKSHYKPYSCAIAQLPGLSDTQRTVRITLCKEAANWLRNLKKQDFLNEDVRVIVPVLSNARGTEIRYWSVIGTKLTKIKAYYAVPPKIAEERNWGVNESPRQRLEEGYMPRLEWRAREYVIPVQEFAEVTLGSKPLTREEFRSICDRCSTKEEVIKALKAASWSGIYRLVFWIALAALICSGSWSIRRLRIRRTKPRRK